jgi:hypothetical protein
MKKVAIILVLLVLSSKTFSQFPDHSITLSPNESFTKITCAQILDSLNLNQTGPEQFEYFEIRLALNKKASLNTFMKNCRSIQSILNKYGEPYIDITSGSNSDIIRPLSGFYYAIGPDKFSAGDKIILTVIYPRTDKM